jgi:hypothetical protein
MKYYWNSRLRPRTRTKSPFPNAFAVWNRAAFSSFYIAPSSGSHLLSREDGRRSFID